MICDMSLHTCVLMLVITFCLVELSLTPSAEIQIFAEIEFDHTQLLDTKLCCFIEV